MVPDPFIILSMGYHRTYDIWNYWKGYWLFIADLDGVKYNVMSSNETGFYRVGSQYIIVTCTLILLDITPIYPHFYS